MVRSLTIWTDKRYNLRMGGRISRLDDSDFAKSVAELYVRGVSHPEMAEELGCSKDTIRVWIKDPRVQAHARRISIERVNRITRKIDGEMEARVELAGDLDIKDLLSIRKEYLDRPLKIGAGEESDLGKVNNELAEAMDDDPAFAQRLFDMAKGVKGK